jgi:nucleoside-diphosphate-sugar epimerase
MKVLIIGGTGLISSAVVAQLVERCDEVSIITRGQSPRSLPAGARHITGDRTEPGFVEQMRAGPNFDCVIDMVCFEPVEAENAVRAFAGRTGQYIFTSTVDVYRKPAGRYPYREDEPYGGISAYAASKVRCEQLLLERHDREGFPVTVIRPASTYGDLQRPVHTLGRSTAYLDRLRRGKPIVVHGDGSSFWVACHADDVARSFAGAVGNPAAIGRTYHVAGEEWHTWDDHHRVVASAIGAPEPRLVHIPTDVLVRLAGPRAELVANNYRFNSIYDNGRARAELGYAYTVTLAQGLPAWYRSLERAGMIENSDLDPFEDELIAAWTSMTDVPHVAA